MICPEQFTPPAMSFAEQLLSIGQSVSKSSLQYMPLNFQKQQQQHFIHISITGFVKLIE